MFAADNIFDSLEIGEMKQLLGAFSLQDFSLLAPGSNKDCEKTAAAQAAFNKNSLKG
jgi:hypothetical protein